MKLNWCSFFCSSRYDLAALTDELNQLFGDLPIVGCTTAGEIGPAGYLDHSIVGLSFPKGSYAAEMGLLQDLNDFNISEGHTFIHTLMQRLERRPIVFPNRFAFLLIDGLSMQEEVVACSLQNALGQIPLIGGSAGDDLKFEHTYLFYQGAFHSNCALLLLISTSHPTQPFKSQHFKATSNRLVVTAADPPNRIISEINGLPAAMEYAHLINVPPDKLGAGHFAASPLVLMIDGEEYVRSIQKANPDNSLTFYCAIDEGLVLRLASGGDMVQSLARTFEKIRHEIGSLQLVLGCDCILRNLEISQWPIKVAAADIFKQQNMVGFSTYGEQYRGVHVNQTLTGVAIGYAGSEAIDAR
ncbi:FIST N-terminal domain-containing protein [Chitinimonas sp. BJB300]|uniref:FIST N-terminal domain-containing protein n=1 Tax=Chitinimonas sp. BJB300 TaxID=1559339 RepID=UPI0027E52000|nr:FIST N-terminal domain-containing protein [Chitinimonas sp. BJB300]